MIEINYLPIYMKINHIFFVIKGQFPVKDYIPNTIILYFIVHCIYVVCLFYCLTCLCLSLTPPVSGLRCIVFNKVMFCSVLIRYLYIVQMTIFAAYMYSVLKTSGCIQVLELVKIRMLSTHRINFCGMLPE